MGQLGDKGAVVVPKSSTKTDIDVFLRPRQNCPWRPSRGGAGLFLHSMPR